MPDPELGLDAVPPVPDEGCEGSGLRLPHEHRILVRRLPPRELRRKALHMLPGLMPFVLSGIPHQDPLGSTAKWVLLVIAGVLLLLVVGSRRWIGRKGEQDLPARAMSYAVVVVGLIFLFPAQPEFAAAVVAVLAFGDGVATLAGEAFGVRPLPWNPKKTWAGTTCFLLAAGPLATLAYWIEARPAVSLPMAGVCGGVAALAGCIAESVCEKVPDNFPTGLAAAVAIVGVHFLILGSGF